MNTNYKPRAYRNDPIQEEISKNLGSFTLSVTVESDIEMTKKFSHIPNFIAFKTTLKKDGEMISIGTGSAVLNQYNKFLSRTVRFAYGSSIVDAIVRSVKILDALSIIPTNQNESEVDLEGRDKQAFFNDEDLPQLATEKQLNFAKKLIENCDEDEKEQYLEQISSPYFSKFQCSQLIQKLMPVK
jgi:hypothetical protein